MHSIHYVFSATSEMRRSTDVLANRRLVSSVGRAPVCWFSTGSNPGRTNTEGL